MRFHLPSSALRGLAGVLLLGGLAGAQELLELQADEASLPPELREVLGHLDPASDGWSNEELSGRVLELLGPVRELLEGRRKALEPSDVPVAEDARVLARFPDLETLESGAFVVRRPVAGQRAQALPKGGPEVFHAQLLALRRRLREGDGEIRVKLKVTGLALRDGGFDARLRYEADVHGDPPRQQRATWHTRWSLDVDGEPVLGEFEVSDPVEVRRSETPGPAGTGPLLTDCSASWFADPDLFDALWRPGIDHWRRRTDAAFRLPLVGHPSGVAVGDVNGDGLEDLYLVQPGGLPNTLLLHGPDGRVRDASAGSGVDFLDFGRSALLVDLDGDGDLDLAVHVVDRLLFGANDGRGRFAIRANLHAPETTSLSAADADGDGDLDLYACAYVSPYEEADFPVPYHDARNGHPNAYFRNDGDWAFVNATAQVGLDAGNDRFSFAAAWEDYDDDGDPDLYVSNDFGRNNLYRNDGGSFVDVAAAAGVEDISAGMGVSWGDYDGDGLVDLYVSNMYSSAGQRVAYQRKFRVDDGEGVRASYRRHARGNSLFRNRGDGTFEDTSLAAGVTMGRWAWGARFVDLDLDGREDLLVPNGFLTLGRPDDL